ncbi:MAG TPA: serine hydrolase domain-containing protein [Candidatus Binatia bacterium]|jgi:D-alanyl-D-alanine carboxypeptidase|nr:serine hydrolase domain-containing protein [Candidatus Binatia bacterium]
MEKWLGAALDYIPRWLEFQMRVTAQPGCAVAVAHNGRVALDEAFGHADLTRDVVLTPRHRFRVASHSKSFTAAGVMLLRERGRLRLDDAVGQYVADLHPDVARVTLAQLLSHSAGLVRDGADAGQWTDQHPFRTAAELREDMAAGTAIEPNSRFKYSNHGFGLLGMVIEAITGEPYATWVRQEIVDAVGLADTLPDVPLPRGTPFARGHSATLPLGRRVVIPGDNSTQALAAATGFVSTASDLTRFFAQLSPSAKKSVLSVASRREMTRAQWRDPHASLERWYGLGTMSGSLGDWGWFGHSGGFQGYITRTAVLPSQALAIAVLTNATDGPSHFWLDGAVRVLRAFARNGAPTRRTAAWTGRWWSLWGAVDLLPMRDTVMVATPAMMNPLLDASEVTPAGRDRGRITLATGFGNHGEPAHLVRNARGRVSEVWLGGGRLRPEAAVARELERRYDGRPSRRRKPQPR